MKCSKVHTLEELPVVTKQPTVVVTASTHPKEQLPRSSPPSSSVNQSQVEFVQTPLTLQPIEQVPLDTMIFMDERVKPNLPTHTTVPLVPSKPYNGVDKLIFTDTIQIIYENIITWKKNLFKVPTGSAGKNYIKLLTAWITKFNKGTSFQGLVMKVVMILPNLIHQKPSATSESKDHTKALVHRLQKWNDGMIKELWDENQIIQKKLTSKPPRSSDDISRVFSKLMFEGKVTQALKFLDESANNLVLPPTTEVVEKLRSLHPDSQPIAPGTLINGPIKRP